MKIIVHFQAYTVSAKGVDERERENKLKVYKERNLKVKREFAIHKNSST